jgi:hypothetical protein
LTALVSLDDSFCGLRNSLSLFTAAYKRLLTRDGNDCETPRVDFFSKFKGFLPEVFPIKASDHIQSDLETMPNTA